MRIKSEVNGATAELKRKASVDDDKQEDEKDDVVLTLSKTEVDQLIKSLIPAVRQGDLETVKDVFEKCRPIMLGFVLNEEEELELPTETNLESMLDWPLLNVACAYE